MPSGYLFNGAPTGTRERNLGNTRRGTTSTLMSQVREQREIRSRQRKEGQAADIIQRTMRRWASDIAAIREVSAEFDARIGSGDIVGATRALVLLEKGLEGRIRSDAFMARVTKWCEIVFVRSHAYADLKSNPSIEPGAWGYLILRAVRFLVAVIAEDPLSRVAYLAAIVTKKVLVEPALRSESLEILHTSIGDIPSLSRALSRKTHTKDLLSVLINGYAARKSELSASDICNLSELLVRSLFLECPLAPGVLFSKRTLVALYGTLVPISQLLSLTCAPDGHSPRVQLESTLQANTLFANLVIYGLPPLEKVTLPSSAAEARWIYLGTLEKRDLDAYMELCSRILDTSDTADVRENIVGKGHISGLLKRVIHLSAGNDKIPIDNGPSTVELPDGLYVFLLKCYMHAEQLEPNAFFNNIFYAFGSILMKAAWSRVSASSLSEDVNVATSSLDRPFEQQADSRWPLADTAIDTPDFVAAFAMLELYFRYLIALSDDEFLDETRNPLSLAACIDLAHFTTRLAFALYWLPPRSARNVCGTSYTVTQYADLVAKVARHLHSRDIRLNFATQDAARRKDSWTLPLPYDVSQLTRAAAYGEEIYNDEAPNEVARVHDAIRQARLAGRQRINRERSRRQAEGREDHDGHGPTANISLHHLPTLSFSFGDPGPAFHPFNMTGRDQGNGDSFDDWDETAVDEFDDEHNMGVEFSNALDSAETAAALRMLARPASRHGTHNGPPEGHARERPSIAGLEQDADFIANLRHGFASGNANSARPSGVAERRPSETGETGEARDVATESQIPNAGAGTSVHADAGTSVHADADAHSHTDAGQSVPTDADPSAHTDADQNVHTDADAETDPHHMSISSSRIGYTWPAEETPHLGVHMNIDLDSHEDGADARSNALSAEEQQAEDGLAERVTRAAVGSLSGMIMDGLSRLWMAPDDGQSPQPYVQQFEIIEGSGTRALVAYTMRPNRPEDVEPHARSQMSHAGHEPFANDTPPATFASQDELLRKRLRLIRRLPFAIPFEIRVNIFRFLVMSDRKRYNISDTFLSPFGPSTTIEIRRSHVVEDSLRLLDPLGPAMRDRIGIVFVDQFGIPEVGIDGGGLFKELLALLMKQIFAPEKGLWTYNASNELYPNPSASATSPDKLIMYRFMGRLIGKALYEGIIINVRFASFFLSKWLGHTAYFNDLPSVDPDLAHGLLVLKHYDGDVQKDLDLNFTIVDTDEVSVEDTAWDQTADHSDAMNIDDGDDIESPSPAEEKPMPTKVTENVVDLVPGGSSIPVTNQNRLEFIFHTVNHRLNKQLELQSRAFLAGLNDVVPLRYLSQFDEIEISELVSGANEDIDLDDLRRNTVYSGWPNEEDNPTIKNFWDVAYRLTPQQRTKLLKFVTASPRPPLMGFKELRPQFAIHCDGHDESRLPTSSTCVNLFKLPAYTSKEALRDKLIYAIEARSGFDLA